MIWKVLIRFIKMRFYGTINQIGDVQSNIEDYKFMLEIATKKVMAFN